MADAVSSLVKMVGICDKLLSELEDLRAEKAFLRQQYDLCCLKIKTADVDHAIRLKSGYETLKKEWDSLGIKKRQWEQIKAMFGDL